ncbi:ABC transporter substrate-binding protein [Halobaculum sp. MBLA0147]|uniref:ABC transporter substrate-binding protein n=1 Tax=Halobaculum sp. MBLA0147 TaxID=3079934 RepID=UPI003525A439
MTRDTSGPAESTRRDYVKYGGALLGSGLVAGCTGDGTGDATATPTDTATETATETETAATDQTATESGDDSYSVEMAPVGTVTFEEPPESVAHYFPGYADMAVALGAGDTVNSVGLPSRYHTDHYDELDGVSVDESSITNLVGDAGISKELFYELESDLHMIDPVWLVENGAFKLEQADIDEISSGVAPFLGNTIFRRTDDWHDYRYYSLYEAFEKVAKVYDAEETFTAFQSFHDEFLAEVQASLPGPDSRPNALLCWQAKDQPESFYPYRLSGKGTNKKAFRDLGITDALAQTGIDGLSESDRGTIDYENLLAVDPDSILLRGHETKSRAEFQDTVVAYMEDHDVASQLTAVEEGRVFRGGPIYTGPLHHLFLVERYATSYFPEQFSGELFDRDELAAIVTGDA